MMYTIEMIRVETQMLRNVCCIFTIALSALFTSPTLASAQAYVPVKDIELNPAFKTYSTNFDKYAAKFDQYIKTDTDSLQNLVAGGDPQGVAIEPCKRGDTFGLEAKAYQNPNQAWATAASTSLGVIPLQIPTGGGKVQINTSGSIRCLLEEMVEWQKLGLSLQIHSLLKTYISDAQSKQLNNQLRSKIAAANLNHAKAGNQVNNNGILSSEPVYNTNRTQSEYNKQGRQVDNILDQASADPTSGNPVGSLGICQPWRLDTAANLARNFRGAIEDPSNGLDSEGTSCNLSGVIDPNDFSKFSESYNNPSSMKGGASTFLSVLNNPGNSPLGASTAADFAAAGRLERQKESSRIEEQSTGFKPTKECSGTADDPYCLDNNSTAVSPSGQNQSNITKQASQGDDQVAAGNTVDGTAASSTEAQSTELNTKSGLLGYDETELATSKTAVNQLIREFYDVIAIGYFAVTTETTEWAQATMLMIYDEMKFNDTEPQTVVTTGTAAFDTQY